MEDRVVIQPVYSEEFIDADNVQHIETAAETTEASSDM